MKEGSMIGLLAVVAAAGVGVYAVTQLGHRAPGGSAGTPSGAPSTGTPSTSAPNTGTAPIPVGNGVVSPGAPVSTLPVAGNDSAAQAAAAAAREAARLAELERQREAEWRKQDTIRALQSELSDVQNRLKVLTAELNRIDQEPMSQPHIQAWSAKHMQSCYSSYVLGLGCNKRNDLSEGWDVKALADWKQLQESRKQPLLVEASQRNTRQLELIANLRQLGVNLTPINAPGATPSTPLIGAGQSGLGGSGLIGGLIGGGLWPVVSNPPRNSTQPVQPQLYTA